MSIWRKLFGERVIDVPARRDAATGNGAGRSADKSFASLPTTATLPFKELMDVYQESEIEFPQLKAVTAAQWALESGWGTSRLAKENNNYAGMKWRPSMEPYGRPVTYKAWDGVDTYCHFHDEARFIQAYWKRLDVIGAYKGWRDHTKTGEDFIRFIGPIWVGVNPTHGREYVKKILDLTEKRTKAVFR